MKAIILAGGKGSRLKEYTEDIPKPMIRILGKTVLEYQLENLEQFGVKNIVLCIGHLGEKVKEYYGDGEKFGVNIEYAFEEEPMGTGGALSYARKFIDDDFILLFGDILLKIDWNRFISFHETKGGLGTFLVHPNSHPFDSDLVLMNEDCRIIGISHKNTERQHYNNVVKSGVHIFKKEILDFVEEHKKQDLEKDIIAKALEAHKEIYGYKTSEYVKDMGTLDRLFQVRTDLEKGLLEKKVLYSKQKCIFVDRDGTVNKLKGLLSRIEDLELETMAAEAIKLINNSGYLCIMVTNQPVVARNLCTIEELNEIHEKLETLLGEEGAYLNDIYYCPHHPDGGYLGENKQYKISCRCRKPDIGMIETARDKYNVDLKASYIIGDTTIDIKTGINAGIHTVLINTGEAGKDNKYAVTAEYTAENLYEAVKIILQKEES